jgi:hypothetical protein
MMTDETKEFLGSQTHTHTLTNFKYAGLINFLLSIYATPLEFIVLAGSNVDGDENVESSIVLSQPETHSCNF